MAVTATREHENGLAVESTTYGDFRESLAAGPRRAPTHQKLPEPRPEESTSCEKFLERGWKNASIRCILLGGRLV
jgi:uracil-DNA glycosylase